MEGLSPSLLNPWFLALLTGLALGRALVPRQAYVHFGAIGSALVIGLASPATLVLLGCSALLVLYPLGAAMRRLRARGWEREKLRPLLWAGVALLLVVWVAYKLTRDAPATGLAASGIGEHLLAAFGFSYFLFRGINYLYVHSLIDMPERSPSSVLYYALFPSTITSGPIQMYRDFVSECAEPIPLRLDVLGVGLYRITQGLFYKVCISAGLQAIANPVILAGPSTGFESLLVVFSLYVTFFFDFAGYSHMAIGLGLILGIRVPENFRLPFLATSITEFWRNWHITLAAWFRDNVFIPAGGMRASRTKAGLLAAGIMLFCGLWHGFTLPFIAWGAWHGALLFTEAVGGSRPMPPAQRHGWVYWRRVAFTNAKVAFGALFFLPSFDAIGGILKGFLTWL